MSTPIKSIDEIDFEKVALILKKLDLKIFSGCGDTNYRYLTVEELKESAKRTFVSLVGDDKSLASGNCYMVFTKEKYVGGTFNIFFCLDLDVYPNNHIGNKRIKNCRP